MIPKIIHYCWFGRNPLPALAKKCIKSWKEFCKDYEIIQWNEDNFDITSAPLYVRQAYEAKKWAFVTDYVRLKVVYDYGGIYLDTDVEVIRSLDDLLEHEAFFGFENAKWIATGLGFGAQAGADILRELMDDYLEIPFIREDGSYDDTSCPMRNTDVFIRYGLCQENRNQVLDGTIRIYSSQYFCPKDYWTGDLRITPNTYTIHHYDASWLNPETKHARDQRILELKRTKRRKKIKYIIHTPFRLLSRILGTERYDRLKQWALRK